MTAKIFFHTLVVVFQHKTHAERQEDKEVPDEERTVQ